MNSLKLIYENIYLKRDIQLGDVLEACHDLGLSYALYRLPNSKENIILIDLKGVHDMADDELEVMKPGFLFSPFSISALNQAKYIQADILLRESGGTYELFLHPNVGSDSRFDLLLDHLNHGRSSTFTPIAGSQTHHIQEVSEEQFLSLISGAMNRIEAGEFQKVVVSRNKSIPLDDSFRITDFYKKLADSYPNALRYVVFTPGTGPWIGATPEVLLSIDKDNIFTTSALAGTQGYDPEIRLVDAAWTQKEIEEQAMVSRYIINCFKKIRLREFEEIGPRTIRAGNLLHLMTKYVVDMNTVNFPQLGTVMLRLLHPTSAICGMPKQPAMDFINQFEGFDREYYSGYLGPINVQDEINLFVNLRCMKLEHRQARLFAGAGITAYSNPRKEWKETEIKMNTMLDLL